LNHNGTIQCTLPQDGPGKGSRGFDLSGRRIGAAILGVILWIRLRNDGGRKTWTKSWLDVALARTCRLRFPKDLCRASAVADGEHLYGGPD
jgi:hypothetical protein